VGNEVKEDKVIMVGNSTIRRKRSIYKLIRDDLRGPDRGEKGVSTNKGKKKESNTIRR